jgi:hypothetical protein
MAAMHATGALRFLRGIDPEEQLDRLAPVSTVRLGVEQAQMSFMCARS